ncbi:hypothetical protein [Pseudomonas sp. dw_358]|uniref:hypothetical protein n=1 Tax=Pseudomonas sp. dw_358 TaxID=2720083 RepID=UPI001BD6A963|nr:hypothetical protein [Pseudomonas sp. dw_358]
MKDNLRADLDHELDLDLDDERGYQPTQRGAWRKPRSANWLAWQIALGIVVGGSVLWIVGATASYVAAKFMLGQLQIGVPGLNR